MYDDNANLMYEGICVMGVPVDRQKIQAELTKLGMGDKYDIKDKRW